MVGDNMYEMDKQGYVLYKGKRVGSGEKVKVTINMHDVQKAYYNTKACEDYINKLVEVMNMRLELLSVALKQGNTTDAEHQKSMLEPIRKRLIYAEYLSVSNLDLIK